MNQESQYQSAEVEMELTAQMEQRLIDLFDIEVEVMQGSREILHDGRHRLKFTVEGEKADKIMSFTLRVIGRTNQICYN